MHKLFLGLSRLMAYLGGCVLVALIMLTCVSVLGRSLNGILHSEFLQSFAPALAQRALDLGIGPVNGDFELIESGVAFAIFAFLPLCQITNGHATVEIFTSKFPLAINRALQFIIDSVFALVLILIAVQLHGGMQSKMRSGETTFLLEFPLWWAYCASLAGAAIAAVVAIYVAFARAQEVFGNRVVLDTPVSANAPKQSAGDSQP